MKKDTQVFGIRAVIEAVQSNKEIDKVYIQKGLRGSLVRELEILLKKHNINSSYVPVEKLNRLTRKNHQGVIATISPITYHNFEDLVINTLESGATPLFLILDHISDVRNFGAIIRTAECTGVHGIIIPSKGAAPVSADTIKTSAGAAFKIPICKVTHIKDAIYFLQDSGIRIVAATEKTPVSIFETSLIDPLAIVMGSEDRGVSPGVLKLVDSRAKLPIMGEIDSLNVSVACGAFLYETLRQRAKN